MRRLWITLSVVMLFGFAVLGWIGTRIYQEMPPIPERVVTTDGREVVGPGEIMRGQHVWQTMGGMETGSVWGHGSYVAPDWTADWLHRESEYALNAWATAEHAASYDRLDTERQAALRARLVQLMRTNRYDGSTGVLTIDPVRAHAFDANQAHYAEVFRDGRADYAIPRGTLVDPARQRALAAFFFWTAWAAAASRPGTDVSYTSNWPYEPLVGNVPTSENIVWTGVSIIILLTGLGGFIWYYASRPAPLPAEVCRHAIPCSGGRRRRRSVQRSSTSSSSPPCSSSRFSPACSPRTTASRATVYMASRCRAGCLTA
jgi:nitric oxide reductase subunit B